MSKAKTIDYEAVATMTLEGKSQSEIGTKLRNKNMSKRPNGFGYWRRDATITVLQDAKPTSILNLQTPFKLSVDGKTYIVASHKDYGVLISSQEKIKVTTKHRGSCCIGII